MENSHGKIKSSFPLFWKWRWAERDWHKTSRLCTYLESPSWHDVVVRNSHCLVLLTEQLENALSSHRIEKRIDHGHSPSWPIIKEKDWSHLQTFFLSGRPSELPSWVLHQGGGRGAGTGPWPWGRTWCDAVLLRASSQGAPEDAALAGIQVNWRQS